VACGGLEVIFEEGAQVSSFLDQLNRIPLRTEQGLALPSSSCRLPVRLLGVHTENNWVNCRFSDGVDAARNTIAHPKTLAAEIALLRRAAVNMHK